MKRFILWVSLVTWGFFSLVFPVQAECWDMPYSTYLNNQSPECDIPLEVAANTIMVKKKAVVSAGGAADTKQDQGVGTGTARKMGLNASTDWYGQKFKAGDDNGAVNYTAGTKIGFYLKETGNAAFNYRLRICNDNAGSPDCSAGSLDSDYRTGNSVGAALSMEYSTVGGTKALTAGTWYWIVVETDGFVDSSNCIETEYDAADAGGEDEVVKTSADGASWTNLDIDMEGKYEVWGK